MYVRKKSFNELTTNELYKILRIRQNIFIIEQKIIYPDIDDKDSASIHFWVEGHASMDILSYLRIIQNETEKTLSIGRVLTTPEARGKGVARLLMQDALDHIKMHFSKWTVSLHAQEYLKDFYVSLGFIQTGPSFTYPDEDPLPHVPMEYKGD
jgi:ElaA protein